MLIQAEEYRAMARVCQELAENTADPYSKRILECSARKWRAIADVACGRNRQMRSKKSWLLGISRKNQRFSYRQKRPSILRRVCAGAAWPQVAATSAYDHRDIGGNGNRFAQHWSLLDL